MKCDQLGTASHGLFLYTESCRMRSMRVQRDKGGSGDLSRACRLSLLTCCLYHSTAEVQGDSERTACFGGRKTVQPPASLFAASSWQESVKERASNKEHGIEETTYLILSKNEDICMFVLKKAQMEG